jgi:hypothetical protein
MGTIKLSIVYREAALMKTTATLVYLVIKIDSSTWQQCSVSEFDNYIEAQKSAQLGNASQNHYKYIVVNPISL